MQRAVDEHFNIRRTLTAFGYLKESRNVPSKVMALGCYFVFWNQMGGEPVC
jgi:hypothetical protein